jgi:hypothetical protein
MLLRFCNAIESCRNSKDATSPMEMPAQSLSQAVAQMLRINLSNSRVNQGTHIINRRQIDE